MLDLRQVFLDQDSLTYFALLFWQQYESAEPFQVGCIESAAIPLLTAVLCHAPKNRQGLNAFIVRKERKSTGLGRVVEGLLKQLPIVLIDDVLNSGSSAEKTRTILALSGHSLSEIFVVVDFRAPAGQQWRTEQRVNVKSIFLLEDLGISLSPAAEPPSQRYSLLWSRSVPGGFPFHIVPKSAPVLANGILYRGSDSGLMQAFIASSGELLWSFEAAGASATKGIWSTPAVYAGFLYFGAYNGNVYCLDSRTGKEVWCNSSAEWVGASPLIVPKHSALYIGLEYARPWARGSVCAIDLTTGEKLWENLTTKFQHGSAAYWVSGDLIIWGTSDHEMSAYEPKTGVLVWSFPTLRSVKYAPAIDEERGLVAFASFDKRIYLLKVSSGEKVGVWETDDICYTTPLFAGDKLFCGSGDKKLYVVDLKSLSLIMVKDLGARVFASPKLIGRRVVIATTGGRVLEIDIDSLEIVGSLQLPDAITNAVTCNADGTEIYISTYMNHLYAFRRL